MAGRNGSNGHKPGVSLTRLAADRKTIDVPIGEEVVTLTYRPQWYTALAESRYRAAREDERFGQSIIEFFVEFIVDWNVTDEKGDVIPITHEGLATFPSLILNELFAAAQADTRPNERSGEPSAAG